MKIGLFTDAYFPIISGVSISVDTLAKELTKLGHEVYIVTNKHEKATEQDHVLRLGGYRLPMKGMHEYRVGKVTRKKIREIVELDLDIIHCHSEFTMGRLGRKAARKMHIPVVHTYHTMLEDYVHFISRLLRAPLRYASKKYSKSFANSSDFVIFPTIKVKRTFDRYGFTKKGYIIPTGIYLEQFRKLNFDFNELKSLRESLGIDKDDFVLLYLGRLSREKSLADLIQYVAKIDKPNVKLLMVGDGPDRQEFEHLAEEHHIKDRVIFAGMVAPQNVGKYYQIADLFLNFSVTETQGLTYIEALASGTPVLAKYDDNLDGVIEDGYNGFTFKKDADFLPLFNKIYSDKVLFNQITHNADKAIQKFSAANFAKNVEAIYKQTL